MRNGAERSAPRYLCENQTVCNTASCTVEELLTEVAKVLQDAIEDFQVRTIDAASDQVEQHRQMVARLEQRLEALDRLEVSQWEKYTLEKMPKVVFDTLNEKLLKEREEVQQALCDAKESLPEPVDFEAKRVMFSEALALLQDPDAPALKKNLMLKQCIERIEYSRKRQAGGNRRYKEPEPMELDIHLKI
jgi:exonuclease VII large subunit